jgi:hypothetical protein
VLWDLQQAAKEASEEGLEILKGCMRDETCDWPTRLRAVEMLWERGYGRPQVSVAMNMTHAFAEVPQVETDVNVWLARKGQPEGPEGDAWLLEHEKGKGAGRVATTEKRTGEAPASVAEAPEHSSKGKREPVMLDLEAEDPLLLDPDPTIARALTSTAPRARRPPMRFAGRASRGGLVSRGITRPGAVKRTTDDSPGS